jgi:spermidine/putrescine transport system substrate-binding protein
VRQMMSSNLLMQLDPAKLQGTANLMPRWKNPPYDPNSQHSMPFNWGTTGLLYNKEVLQAEPTDWNFLWDNRDALSGKMTLLDDVRETMGMVLKSLGYSYNATDSAQLEAAYRKLMQIKPNLAGFKSFGWEDQLVAGDLAVCMTYSLLGNSLPLENPQLVYVIPKSGTSIWTDTMAIPVQAPNVDAAYAWINFILEPENAAYAATLLKLGTPNQAAFELLPAATKSNTKVYPTEALLKVSEGIASVGAAQELYDRYWTEVKSA